MMDTIKSAVVKALSFPKTITMLATGVAWLVAKVGLDMDNEAVMGVMSPLVLVLVGLLAKDKVKAKKEAKEALKAAMDDKAAK